LAAVTDRELIPQKVEVARAIYDGWVSGNVGSALEFLDPEVVWEAIADAPDAGVYRGHAGVRLYMEDWLEDFDILSMDFEEVVDARDRLVIVQCGRTIGKGSGVKTELRYAVAYWFRGGRIVGIKEFRTKGEALEAAGLPKEGVRSRTPS
jgi:ketosteroid isomerase-like protein